MTQVIKLKMHFPAYHTDMSQYLNFLCSTQNFGGAYSCRLVRPSVRQSARHIRVRPITSLFEIGFRNYFTQMTTMLRRRVARNIWVPTLNVKIKAWPFRKKCLRPITLLFEINLKTISNKWSPYWDDVSSAIFRLLSWRWRSQHDLTAKSCTAHFVI